MKTKNDALLSPGGIISAPGNSAKNFTSLCRKGVKPEFRESYCIHCFFCWVFCPDNAIMVEDDKITGINYDFCKGCGICANECPVIHELKPIVLIKESFE